MRKKPIKKRTSIKGKVISPGMACGKAFIYRDILSRDQYFYNIEREDLDEEMGRIKKAMGLVQKDLSKIKTVVESDLDKEHAQVFQVHKEILKDVELLRKLEKELKAELVNAEQVTRNVFRKYAARLRSSKNESIKSKAEDVEDLGRRLLKVLLRHKKSILENLPKNRIVVSKRLLPSDTVRLKKQNVKGILVEEGSASSHSAILARGLDIPAISNPEISALDIPEGCEMILDGQKGTVIFYPGKNDRNRYLNAKRSLFKQKSMLIKKAKGAAKTKDGKKVVVHANIASEDEVKFAKLNGYDGIGLFRIEQLYIKSKILPDKERLVRSLSKILRPAKKKEITIRLLDLGGDKQLPYLEIERDYCPSMGLRGIRLLLKNESMLKTQIEAVLEISKNFDIRIMLPMVTLPREVQKVKEIAKKCGKKPPKIGSMIETPAAAINIEKIAEVSDFLSLGTNDLIQYTMAAGRENPSVSGYFEEGAKIVLQYIKKTAKAAERAGIGCCICGELAGNTDWTETLLKAGLSCLSVSPLRIPEVKDKIRNIKIK